MPIFQMLLHDARYGFRQVFRRPGLTLTATLTLALGIGGNSAIFSAIDAVLLRPLSWPDPDRLVSVWEMNRKQGVSRAFPSSANFFDWKEQSHAFEAIAHWRFVYFNLAGDQNLRPERAQGARVSAEFFRLLGARPAWGRDFVQGEEQSGRDDVAILSYGFWQGRFGGRADAIGRSILVDGSAATVVGILPREFRMFRVLNRELDLYMPLALDRSQRSRDDHSLNVYARLRRDAPLSRAQGELDAIAGRLEREFPATNTGWGVQLLPLGEALARRSGPVLVMLLAAVGMVLAIACANVANLLLARANSRRKEIAIRMAAGGSALRIVQQLLAESFWLAAAGGGAGLLLAWWAVSLLNARISYHQLVRIHDFRIDTSVLWFTLAVSLLAGVLFGLAPALRSVQVDVSESLRSASGRTAGRRGGLVVLSEVALTTMLSIGAGAVLKDTLRYIRMNRGLDAHNVLTMQIGLPETKYPEPAQMADFFDRLGRRLRTLPGVEAASVVNYPPAGLIATSVPVEGATNTGGETPVARYWVVGPEYFSAVRLPLLAGRAFEERDRDESRGVAVVSQSFARRFFPGGSAIGKQIRPQFPESNAFWIPYSKKARLTIVGVVSDVNEDGLAEAALPQMYLPYPQNPTRIAHVLVRTSSDPRRIAAAARSEVWSVDRDQPVFDVRTLEDVVSESFSQQQVLGLLLGVFAGVALILAAVGIYGVVAYTTSARTREVGIRVALGAQRRDVMQLVLRQALTPVFGGVALGLGGAAAANRVLAGVLAGTHTFDGFLSAAVGVLLICVAGAAAYGPALRAARTEPLAALRWE